MRPFDIPIAIVLGVLGGIFIYRRLRTRREERVAIAEEGTE